MLNTNMIKGAFYGLLASLIWGAWPVLSKMATQNHLSAADITALRFVIAGCLLLPVLLYKGIKFKLIASKGLILASGAGAPYVFLASTGLNYAPSAHFGLIAPSAMLIFTAIGGYYLLGEKFHRNKLIGIMFIIAGILVVGSNSLTWGLTKQLGNSNLYGDLMFLVCGLLWASYTLLCKHWQLGSWAATGLVSVVSMVIYLPIYLISFDSQLSTLAIDTLLFQGIFQGVVVAILALYFYSQAVSLLGSSNGSIFSALVPPTALILGSILLNEQISNMEYLGLFFVCLGMIFSLGFIPSFKLTLKVKTQKKIMPSEQG